MNKKAVLYVGGGAMAGVFGAGVVTNLQEANVYGKISHVYGASAGAFNIAYFLDKQTKKGSTIYWEDLIKGFIYSSKFPKAIMNMALGRKDFQNIVDIDYLIQVAKTTKRLDLEKIKKNPIEAKVKVYNLKTKKIKYLDLKKDTFQRLKESSSVAPYFYSKGQENIDGDILDSLGYDFIRSQHPEEKLIFVLNHRINRGKFTQLRKILEGKLVAKIFKDSGLKQMFKEELTKRKKDIEKINLDENALLITPPWNNPSNNSTTNPKKLKQTHYLGMVEAEKILDFIGR
ncbi:hypothetical protein HOD29_05685 [archaeon]|jgi:predicted patatin/cPLA2 family phospholipase|nr:hypothetical protein [archaeon]